MDKVEMKRSQIRDKFGFHVLCNFFCVFARGRKRRECNFQDETETLRIVRAHCREAENALAVHHNIKLID